MVHATPRDPIFEYLRGDATDAEWCAALEPLAERGDTLLIGHTHLPFVRRVDGVTVVNPGSLGQPKDGDPRGCYAVLDDDGVALRRIAYDVEAAVARLMQLDIPERSRKDLARILRTGGRLV
jgi:diadenosine tetraphosphatase ApaH/serine/threonine PP2A family protein phosphatase